MSALSTAEAVVQIRALVGDNNASRTNLVRDETPAGKVDGTNKRFRCVYFPLTANGDVEVRINGVLQTITTHYTLDLPRGIINMVAAPTVGPPPQVLAVTYRFYWFEDADYHEMIYNAGQNVGVTGTGVNPADRAADTILLTADGLMDALRHYAACQYNRRRADEGAHRFTASAGGQSVNVDVVTKNFQALATDFCDRADKFRTDYYTRRGARDAPAADVTNYRGAGATYTPRR